MSNQNNCATCDYREPNVDGAHCYMWKNAPVTVCQNHTGRKVTVGRPSRFGSASMIAMILAETLRKTERKE